jgi:fructokinase
MHATFVIPRPAAFDALSTDAGQMGRLEQLHADWLYFGTLAQTDETNCRLIGDICGRMAGVRGFYDMNLREGHWSLALVQRLSTLANVVKMNDEEAEILGGLTWPGGAFSLEDFCRGWAGEHRLEVICVTLGSQGCAVFTDGALHRFPGYKVPVADTVGAGDAFAAGFVHALSQPWPLETRAAFANALGALVASRPGATPDWTPEECRMLMTEDQSLRP